MKKLKKTALLFSIGCGGYSLIEVLWRGFTHWTMGVTGGVCMCLLNSINQKCKKASLPQKCVLGSAVITGMELFVGCIVNRKLKWDVWDYSDLPFNVKGQICPFFSILWFFLCIPVMHLSTFLQKNVRSLR